MKKIIIAIDGYSSTGKSTVAKQLADYLDYTYVDSGAMYRAVALFALQNNYISKNSFDQELFIKALPEIELDFKKENDNSKSNMFLNGVNVEKEIRSMYVSDFVSPVATLSEVRKKLVAIQHQMGFKKGIVMDGRDIGTIVFPNSFSTCRCCNSVHSRILLRSRFPNIKCTLLGYFVAKWTRSAVILKSPRPLSHTSPPYTK